MKKKNAWTEIKIRIVLVGGLALGMGLVSGVMLG